MPALAKFENGAAKTGRSALAWAGDLSGWVTAKENGLSHLDLLVPGMHCAGCISRIEKRLGEIEGVETARVNLSTKRVAIDWRTGQLEPGKLLAAVEDLGFDVRPFAADEPASKASDAVGRELLLALAVAGFAAGNVMLLSVSIWSGAEAATRDLFHWISALIALPAIAYSSRPFLRSAFAALRNGHLNMDVPISLAVVLAAGMSLYETATGGADAYFDAAVMLLFFLLAGRTLDHMMRARAYSAVNQLVSLNAQGATVIEPDGRRRFMVISAVRPGMRLAVMAGERVPADGQVVSGSSDLDRSIVTGEAAPERIQPGDAVEAGTLNLTGAVEIEVSAAGEDSFLAEVVRMMEAAEQGKSRFVRLADRAAAIYAPLVHVVAALTFIGWLAAGAGWHAALLTAVAVLIITCPCALGLAVPAVQVVASGVLMRSGIMIKDGAVLERLAGIDTVVFDKTGTLTKGNLKLEALPAVSTETLAVAAGLAQHSTHPLSRALAGALANERIAPAVVEDVSETPGYGLRGMLAGREVRIGSRDWTGAPPMPDRAAAELFFAADGEAPQRFTFRDDLREDAAPTVSALRAMGFETIILSGDRAETVAAVAGDVGVDSWHAGLKPQDKAAFVSRLEGVGRQVLMVGDGINDAPALAAAHASMAPASASDIGRTAAGLVFLGTGLGSVTKAVRTARWANRLVKQNFALAALYNLIAVPVAIAGLASPLVAAIAMSTSSLVVTGNALRLRWKTGPGDAAKASSP